MTSSSEQFRQSVVRVLLSPFTWLRVAVAAVFVALLLALISALVLGEGFSESLFGGWFVWALIALVAVAVPLDRVIEAEQRQGRQPSALQVLRLSGGLGAVAAGLYAGLGVAGAFDSGVRLEEVEARAVKVVRAKRARCSQTGEDAVGDPVYRCDMTLRGSKADPDLEGEHLDRCFSLSREDPVRLTEISCMTAPAQRSPREGARGVRDAGPVRANAPRRRVPGLMAGA